MDFYKCLVDTSSLFVLNRLTGQNKSHLIAGSCLSRLVWDNLSQRCMGSSFLWHKTYHRKDTLKSFLTEFYIISDPEIKIHNV